MSWFSRWAECFRFKRAGLVVLPPLAAMLCHQAFPEVMVLFSAAFAALALLAVGFSAMEYLSVGDCVKKFPSSIEVLNLRSFTYKVAWKTETFRSFMFLPGLVLAWGLMLWIDPLIQVVGIVAWVGLSWRLIAPQVHRDYTHFWQANQDVQEQVLKKVMTLSLFTATRNTFVWFQDGEAIELCLEQVKKQDAYMAAQRRDELSAQTADVVHQPTHAPRRL